MRTHKHDATLREYFENEGFPLEDRMIANVCGIPSKSTVQRYRKENRIPDAKCRRSITDACLRTSIAAGKAYADYTRLRLEHARTELRIWSAVSLFIAIAAIIALCLV